MEKLSERITHNSCTIVRCLLVGREAEMVRKEQSLHARAIYTVYLGQYDTRIQVLQITAEIILNSKIKAKEDRFSLFFF